MLTAGGLKGMGEIAQMRGQSYGADSENGDPVEAPPRARCS